MIKKICRGRVKISFLEIKHKWSKKWCLCEWWCNDLIGNRLFLLFFLRVYCGDQRKGFVLRSSLYLGGSGVFFCFCFFLGGGDKEMKKCEGNRKTRAENLRKWRKEGEEKEEERKREFLFFSFFFFFFFEKLVLFFKQKKTIFFYYSTTSYLSHELLMCMGSYVLLVQNR